MDLPEREQKILEFWEKNLIFEKTLRKEAVNGDFVFYEGPPTANGKPGIHHIEARSFKDLIPRYKTMRGFRVLRKAGWDTHGLPVELEVEKKLGLKSKKDIEEYGIEKFNQKCKESVWEYKDEWEKITKRIGFWVDLENPYITYETDYIETLWWIIKQADEKGFLYKGHKVVPNCPRCGTALSSHEVAQGYKNVSEESVYARFKIKGKENDYILAWTTTPWTLPGNVALAVGSNIEYVKIKNKDAGDNLILAKERLAAIDGEYEILEELKGADLVGLEYEPLFSGAIPENTPNFEKAFKVYSADFVSTEDGIGVVHTAVMYGIDDYELGEKIGLPKFHTVNSDGTFNESVPKWKGKFVKDTDKEIISDLESRGFLFKTENYSHDYPFCWRCGTPLLYYAKDSWFFKMSGLRDELVKNNEKINWIPGHIKEGRFGEWLKDAKDWAISRERYWGTPMPVWECEKCGKRKIAGSIDEIREEFGNPNKIFLVRHGEAETTLKGVGNSMPETEKYPLTGKGRDQIKELAKILKDEKINFIYASPILRTKETAEIIADKLGLEIIFDERLRETGLGEFNNKKIEELHSIYPTKESRAGETVRGVESGRDVRKRFEEFLSEINQKHKNKNIAVVSHGDPLQIFYGLCRGEDLMDSFRGWYPKKGETKIVYSKPVDLHRPFIDEVKLKCECGADMKRAAEVMDCWFDSGSMPFAQVHYPFENKGLVDDKKLFPADFISEAIDQTRGWFYTLLAVSTMLGFKEPYKNAICLGHVLDKNGQKMSKSKGNVVNPWEMIDKYGADSVRWYLYTVNQPGEQKRFDENDLKLSKRMFTTLFNVLSFYKMFSAAGQPEKIGVEEPAHVLDKWILNYLAKTEIEITDLLEKYDITSSARKIEAFINDLSVWYLRRSRERFKGEDEKDKAAAQKTLGEVLLSVSKLLAPFAPFSAEAVYKELCEEKESVHLENWTKADEEYDEKILEEMARVRNDVSVGLDLRLKSGIKVRQPLSSFETPNKFGAEFSALIKDELNVKEIKFGKEYKIDARITDELKKEGMLREITRAIQDLRKKAGFVQSDKIILAVDTDAGGKDFMSGFEEKIKSATNLSEIKFVSFEEGEKFEVGESSFRIKIEK
ncbi:MAG: class I tRNA ligase family protein [Candidatus Pacebacteria bacterium]|nr:class I tRNA ligase family protein [Candidatus Paceibacterota bacterium]